MQDPFWKYCKGKIESDDAKLMRQHAVAYASKFLKSKVVKGPLFESMYGVILTVTDESVSDYRCEPFSTLTT